ncbi:MAG TPA: YcxB family protein [Chthoniobacteraceae bacterium]|nr:YcxB family protein [Chthoniobacteraceae bacterium]
MDATKTITASYPFVLETALPGWELHQKGAGLVNRVVLWTLGGVMVLLSLPALAFGPGALMPLAIGIVCLCIPSFIARTMRRVIERRQAEGGTVEGKFSEDSVAIHNGKSQTQLKWDALRSAVLAKEGILLYQGKYNFHWFPRSAFQSQEDYEACVGLVARKVKPVKRKGV